MGLPSGTRWAPYNIGANAPEEFGEYFSWGNIDGHAEDSGYEFSEDNYDSSPGAQVQSDLPLANDMARANWGGTWRTPTAEQFQELIENSYNGGIWTKQNGVNGLLFRSRINGNSIFLPATGYYDGDTLEARDQVGSYWLNRFYSEVVAYSFSFSSQNVTPEEGVDRYFGYSVRAVIPG